MRSTMRAGMSLGVLALAIMSPQGAKAQVQELGSLAGEVVSPEGDPLAGVSVMLGDTGRTSVSEEDGSFRFDAVSSGRHELVLSLMGCALGSRVIEVGSTGAIEIRVILGHRIVPVEGVMVSVPSIDLIDGDVRGSRDTSAARTVRPEAARNVADLVRGISGGRVVQGSGMPGSDADVLLRGPASIGGAEQRPLVVVDGIAVGHSVGDIDPMDVERIEVLKGAAASALYGSRAHGGVIEITTKRRPTDHRERAPAEPLLLVDGVVSDSSLGQLDVREILDVRMLQGPSARLLAGRHGEAGIISVTTIHSPGLVGACPQGFELWVR
jgi:TonB-dependent starch-binding outer membrane protein SusC